MVIPTDRVISALVGVGFGVIVGVGVGFDVFVGVGVVVGVLVGVGVVVGVWVGVGVGFFIGVALGIIVGVICIVAFGFCVSSINCSPRVTPLVVSSGAGNVPSASAKPARATGFSSAKDCAVEELSDGKTAIDAINRPIASNAVSPFFSWTFSIKIGLIRTAQPSSSVQLSALAESSASDISANAALNTQSTIEIAFFIRNNPPRTTAVIL